jgi:RNA polymerase sigma-70 factor (ECF subfamily)
MVSDHGPIVFRLACRILGVGPDAEDAVQEAFLQVYRIGQEQSVEHWGALLRRVVVHRALDRLRQRRRQSTEPLDGRQSARNDENPPQLAIAGELAGRLREAVGQLPEQQASVFCLRYFEELSYQQIAASLGMEVGGVATALHKARGKLKAMLMTTVYGD